MVVLKLASNICETKKNSFYFLYFSSKKSKKIEKLKKNLCYKHFDAIQVLIYKIAKLDYNS